MIVGYDTASWRCQLSMLEFMSIGSEAVLNGVQVMDTRRTMSMFGSAAVQEPLAHIELSFMLSIDVVYLIKNSHSFSLSFFTHI